MKTDPIVDSVCADLQARSAVGIAKYGVTLNDAVDIHSLMYWLQHAYEETLDKANYLKAAIESLRKGRPLTTPESVVEQVVNADLQEMHAAYTKAQYFGVSPFVEGRLETLKSVKAALHGMQPIDVCSYPHCDCSVSFPAGMSPSITSCPRAGRTP